ncbi:5-guanidino-2-oxopentanoate decarboxylase [Mycolicibacterium sp. CH28]|uniref:5-guanidino-2-oxopentanoate decarboxylase n=1 Tax=Mycolicibacterium sp. CH28 TaxID=2512237 RepID=UPI0010807B3C|nr:5-guanidino-2-oxopentanoate decarboxylase [Mycolicibacterium sp. CH28]TGD87506.1 5-guanidino-2-oxopentanoate decarboxylase [Mycolicibacterium sp. CH28]
MTMTCGEHLVRLLEAHGVDTVFGIPGVHTLEIYRGLHASPITHITPRHEQGVGFMADGYARRSGRPGVAIVISGPGITNIATPVASAYHDSIPMLVISSVVSTTKLGRETGTIHDLPDQAGFMSTVTASSETVLAPADLAPAVSRAFALLRGRRPRPVHIQIPTDVLAQPADPASPVVANPEPPLANPATVAEAAQVLSAAQRLFIVAGGGARDCGQLLTALADRTDALIGCTIGGKSVVAEDHPRCVGSAMTFEPLSRELLDADVVLAVGTEFSELDYWALPGGLRLTGTLIRIDIDPGQVGRKLTPALALVGDAYDTLSALLDQIDARPEGSARTVPPRAELTLDPSITPHLPLLDALDAALPRDRIFAGDSTQPAYAANHLFPVYESRSWLMPIGFAALGCALPMAIGAKVASPDKPVVALVGDAGLLFSVAELATAVDLGIALPVVVWNNHGYGEIRDAMDHAGIAHLGTDASVYDATVVAKGFGCHGVRATSPAELRDLVVTALGADVPTVIEVRADQFDTAT